MIGAGLPLEQGGGRDVEVVAVALAGRQAFLPPAVLAEPLSDPKLPGKTRALFKVGSTVPER